MAASSRRPPLRIILFWLALAVPAGLMIADLAGGALAMDLLHPTGELSLRLMIAALVVGPLIEFFGANRFLAGWLAIRRHLGVAAFGYAALHLAFYAIDMGALAPILTEFTLPAILTGWLGFAFMLAAAVISNDAAQLAMGRRRWKQVQQGVYLALLLSLAHWILLDRAWGPALIHFTPVLIAWALRLAAHIRHSKGTT